MTLRARLAGPGLLVAPGIYDAFTALLAEQAGFEAVYLSGASIAYTQLGRPDLGLSTFTEVEQAVARIADRVAVPILVDADTGFGNALNVQRTVRGLERAGAAAIQLEDQAAPKRCGHLDGKTLIATTEMRGKLHAALDARTRAETLIVARTDAVAVEGTARAFERAEAYLDSGADILFIEALRSVDELREAGRRFGARVPLLANMVEGGLTPQLSAAQLSELGFRIAIFPGGTTRAVAHALQGYFRSLREQGSTLPWRDRMLDFEGLNALIGTPELMAQAARYAAEADLHPARSQEKKPHADLR